MAARAGVSVATSGLLSGARSGVLFASCTVARVGVFAMTPVSLPHASATAAMMEAFSQKSAAISPRLSAATAAAVTAAAAFSAISSRSPRPRRPQLSAAISASAAAAAAARSPPRRSAVARRRVACRPRPLLVAASSPKGEERVVRAPPPSRRRHWRERSASFTPPRLLHGQVVVIGRSEGSERVDSDSNAFRVIAAAGAPP